jgi:hypothetical protein
MLSKGSQRYPKMKSKQGLMTALVGIAVLAMPITAMAGDHGRHWQSAHAARVAERASLTGAPVMVGRHGNMIAAAPVPSAGPECGFNGHDNGRHLGWFKHRGFAANNSGMVCDEDGDDCRPAGYGYRNTNYGYQAPMAAYPMPAAYQTPYYGSGFGGPVMAPVMAPMIGGIGGTQPQMMAAKAQAKAQYEAALRSHNRGAIRSAQQNLNMIDRQIARMNVRTTGVPYASYGSNLSRQPLHKRLLNGLFGGGTAYNTTPAYGNALGYNNYNSGALPGIAAYQNQGYGAGPVAQGYGSPYAGGSSMLAPLLGSFIH